MSNYLFYQHTIPNSMTQNKTLCLYFTWRWKAPAANTSNANTVSTGYVAEYDNNIQQFR